MTRRAEPVVAIDGPAGAGKSTVAAEVARRLGYVLVDTGALYRGVALAARESGVAWDDAGGLSRLCAALDLELRPSANGRGCALFLGGRDRSKDIRAPEISQGASDVSRFPEVRQALLSLQRRFGQSGGAVLEGRDIGTVVFPDAEVKVFLTASAEERARRRVEELKLRGFSPNVEQTRRAIEERDAQDSSRVAAPLRAAEGALVLDTTRLPFEAVVEQLIALVRAARETEKGQEGGA